jgi:hypothetical protein
LVRQGKTRHGGRLGAGLAVGLGLGLSWGRQGTERKCAGLAGGLVLGSARQGTEEGWGLGLLEDSVLVQQGKAARRKAGFAGGLGLGLGKARQDTEEGWGLVLL